MTLVKRSSKGSPLTASEHDNNLEHLEARTGAFVAASLTALLASKVNFQLGSIVRVDDQGWRYKVADVGATDHHLTTAGGAKLYVLPGADGFYDFDAFDPAGDGATDDYDVLQTALGASGQLKFGTRNYAIGQTVFFKQFVYFRGNSTSLDGGALQTIFTFPANVKGFKFERHDTLDGVVVASGGRADGSKFSGISVKGSGTSTAAHGIHANCRIDLQDVYVEGFGGDGVHIEADSSTSVSNPAIYGNANCFQIDQLHSLWNGGSGLYVAGYDANAGRIVGINCSFNGRWGLFDNSFLGLTIIAAHTEENGIAPAGKNGRSVGALVHHDGAWYSTIPAVSVFDQGTYDAAYSVNAPDVSPTYWKFVRVAGGGHQNAPDWVNGGTYVAGGAYRVVNGNARSVLLGCYAEEGQGLSAIVGPSIVMGGMYGYGFSYGGGVSAIDGTNMVATTFIARAADQEIILGDADGSDQVLFFRNYTENVNLPWRFKFSNGNWVMDAGNGVHLAYYITGELTTEQFGTGAAVPYIFGVPVLGIGSGGAARRQTTGVAAPKTGRWAAGDIVWNVVPTAGGTVGWVCVTTGSPGTWKPFGSISS